MTFEERRKRADKIAKEKDEATYKARVADFKKAQPTQKPVQPTAQSGNLSAFMTQNNVKPAQISNSLKQTPAPMQHSPFAPQTPSRGIGLFPKLPFAATQTPSAPPTGLQTLANMHPANHSKPETKQFGSKIEEIAYKLGDFMGSKKPDTIGGGLRYNLAKGVQGAASAVEGITDFVVGGLDSTLSTITSLGGLAPNAVSEWWKQGAEGVYKNKIAQSMGEGIDDKAETPIPKMTKLGGDIYNVAGNMLTGMGAGKAFSAAGKASSAVTGSLAKDATRFAPEAARKLAIGASAGGSSAQQAYQEGASATQAAAFGNVAGALEATIESISGGIPGLGEGFASKAVKKFIKYPKALAVIGDVLGEGGEEVLSAIITPYIQRIMYNPEAENATLEELAKEFAMGAALSGLMQGGKLVGNINLSGKANDASRNSSMPIDTQAQLSQPPTVNQNAIDIKVPTETQNAVQGIVEPATANVPLKEKQAKIITDSNPMTDGYHVGVRNSNDIKTFVETLGDSESFVYGDFSQNDAQNALSAGEVTVYSSKPIGEVGEFVSTSKNMAQDYAGNGQVFEKTIPLEHVAWINGDEGQYSGDVNVIEASEESVKPANTIFPENSLGAKMLPQGTGAKPEVQTKSKNEQYWVGNRNSGYEYSFPNADHNPSNYPYETVTINTDGNVSHVFYNNFASAKKATDNYNAMFGDTMIAVDLSIPNALGNAIKEVQSRTNNRNTEMENRSGGSDTRKHERGQQREIMNTDPRGRTEAKVRR